MPRQRRLCARISRRRDGRWRRRQHEAASGRVRAGNVLSEERVKAFSDLDGLVTAALRWLSRPDRPRHCRLACYRRILREPRPPMQRPGPPGSTPPLTIFLYCEFGALPQAVSPGSLGPLLGDARQQSANLCLPVPAVTAKGPDGRELSSLGPPRYGLGVHPEHCGDLCRRKQRLGLRRACRHFDGLSSWTGTAIPAFVAVPGSYWGTCLGCPI